VALPKAKIFNHIFVWDEKKKKKKKIPNKGGFVILSWPEEGVLLEAWKGVNEKEVLWGEGEKLDTRSAVHIARKEKKESTSDTTACHEKRGAPEKWQVDKTEIKGEERWGEEPSTRE